MPRSSSYLRGERCPDLQQRLHRLPCARTGRFRPAAHELRRNQPAQGRHCPADRLLPDAARSHGPPDFGRARGDPRLDRVRRAEQLTAINVPPNTSCAARAGRGTRPELRALGPPWAVWPASGKRQSCTSRLDAARLAAARGGRGADRGVRADCAAASRAQALGNRASAQSFRGSRRCLGTSCAWRTCYGGSRGQQGASRAHGRRDTAVARQPEASPETAPSPPATERPPRPGVAAAAASPNAEALVQMLVGDDGAAPDEVVLLRLVGEEAELLHRLQVIERKLAARLEQALDSPHLALAVGRVADAAIGTAAPSARRWKIFSWLILSATTFRPRSAPKPARASCPLRAAPGETVTGVCSVASFWWPAPTFGLARQSFCYRQSTRDTRDGRCR